MKLRTKLIISFCIIIFVPVTLAALAMCGFRYFQLRDIANTYQVEDGNISYLTNTVQMWNRVTKDSCQKLLDTAAEVIKRNFDNPDFDMNMLASELNMGRSKMFLRLKEVVGLTPNEFTLKLKLEEALRLLQEEPQSNISEISYKLGFTSPRYFSRCFKAFYGVAPLYYRKDTPRDESQAGKEV
mgnify:CR=1 FL=1